MPANTIAMPPHIKAMCDDLTKLHTEAEEIRSKYKGKDKKDMPGDEAERWEKILDDADALGVKIDEESKFYRLNQAVTEDSGLLRLFGTKGPQSKDDDVAMKAWGKYLQSGEKSVFTPEEAKSLSLSNPTAGGFLAAPELFIQTLIKDIDDLMVMRRLTTGHFITDNSSIGAPKLDTDVDDAEWIGENDAITYSEMALGKREMKPHFSAKGIKISRSLISKSVMPIEEMVRQRMAYKFALTEEKGFLTGNGVNQPLGVFTASPQGISTGQDTTVATGGTIAAEDVMNVHFAIKSGYANRGTWLFHRHFQKTLRKMKDTDGNYLWQPFDMPGRQLTGGNPGTIMGRPYEVSEHAPGQTSNAWVNGQYVAVFGDFSYYWTLTAMMMEWQTLTELYSETNMFAYIARMWVDGMPILENAFQRLKYTT